MNYIIDYQKRTIQQKSFQFPVSGGCRGRYSQANVAVGVGQNRLSTSHWWAGREVVRCGVLLLEVFRPRRGEDYSH